MSDPTQDEQDGQRLSDDQIKQAIDDRNNARLKMYEEIADQNDEARAAEFEDIPDDAHQRFQQSDDDQPDSRVPDNQETEKISLKVNGKVVELPLDEVIARAQMVESADQYLAEAKRIRLDALQHNQAHAKPAEPVQPVEDDLALVRAIQMGSEEEAVQAIRQLRSPTIDLPRLIDERMTFQQAATRVQDEYKDIFSDPILKQAFLTKDAELVAQGDGRSYFERYSSIGDELREWVGGVRKTSPTVDKQQRKQSVTSINPASSRVSAQVQEEPEESVSDVIASMARTRGQVR